MNHCSRIESTGSVGKIHVSEATADILQKKGYGHWLSRREDQVEAKGKGQLETYWAIIPEKSTYSHADTKTSQSSSSVGSERDTEDEARLVKWNVEVLSRLLKQIVERRQATAPSTTRTSISKFTSKERNLPMDEVAEIILLPEFNQSVAVKQSKKATPVELNEKVLHQLEEYVTAVAYLYQNNPFHNLRHASHVLMSVVKLMSRIVAPEELYSDTRNNEGVSLQAQLHDHTYGITSDPLTQFACALAAIIHDVDHTGVPNAQLLKEKRG